MRFTTLYAALYGAWRFAYKAKWEATLAVKGIPVEMFAERTKPLRQTASAEARGPRGRDHVAALANGLLAIEAFSNAQQELTLSEVARRTALTRAAARRYLHTLVAGGYAETDGKHFRLTSRVLRLGYAYLSSAPLPQLAQPILDEIGEQTEDVAALAVLDGMDAVFVACSSPRRIIAALTRVGTRLPALSSSTGRVLLAGRPDDLVARMIERAGRIQKLTPKTLTSRNELKAVVRRARVQGFSVSDDEVEIGLRSIAVPVMNRAGTVVAALGVSVHSARMRADQLARKFLPILIRASRRLEMLL